MTEPAARLPGVVGVGTDLVDVDRVRRALERRPGLRTRLFTESEWAYATRHRDPHPHLAARFAAKEAVMKALGRGMSSMGFAEIEVVRDDSGAPSNRASQTPPGSPMAARRRGGTRRGGRGRTGPDAA